MTVDRTPAPPADRWMLPREHGAYALVIAPLAKAAAERGSADFMQLWSGQAGLRAEAAPSAQIFRWICDEALAILR